VSDECGWSSFCTMEIGKSNNSVIEESREKSRNFVPFLTPPFFRSLLHGHSPVKETATRRFRSYSNPEGMEKYDSIYSSGNKFQPSLSVIVSHSEANSQENSPVKEKSPVEEKEEEDEKQRSTFKLIAELERQQVSLRTLSTLEYGRQNRARHVAHKPKHSGERHANI